MPYPEHSPLTLAVRRLIMVTLISLFFIIAPLVILYTAGFRYNFRERRVEQTGVISIDAKPVDLAVYLNTVKINKSMPIRLANRAPGTYHIVFKKDGYQTWERDITVTSQQTTYIKNVTLFKDMLPVALFDTPLAITSLSGSPDGSTLLAISQDEGSDEVTLITTKLLRKTLLKRVKHNTITHILWSPNDNQATILTNNGTTVTVDLVDGEQEKIVSSVIVPSVTGDVDLLWTKDIPGPVVRMNADLLRLTANGSSVVGTLPQNTTVWFLDANTHLWIMDTQAILTDTTDPATRLQLPIDTKSIIDMNEARIIVKTESGISILSRADGHETGNLHVDRIRWNATTKEWLAWSASELWTIYEDGHAILLNRTSEKMTDVVPLDPYGVLLLATSNMLFGFNPGYYVTHTLTRNATIDSVVVNQKLHSIYFIGDIGNRRDLFTLEY